MYSWMPLHLAVEDEAGIHHQPHAPLDVPGERFLVRPLDRGPLLLEGGVPRERLEKPQTIEVRLPPLADRLGDEARETGIAAQEPAPGSDAVRLVVDPAREQLLEVGEGGAPEYRGVEAGDAVDREASRHAEVRHVYLAGVVHDGHALLARLVAREAHAHGRAQAPVDLLDDLQVPRQQPLQEVGGPLLERLGQDRVVGVGDRALGQRPRIVPAETLLVHQHAHQLRDGERRVRVVQLEDGLLRKVRPGPPLALPEAPDHVLQRRGHEEVLLLEPQLLAGVLVVRRVEHLGDVLAAGLVLDRLHVLPAVEAREVELAASSGRTTAAASSRSPLP